ncbi:MAG: DUF1559 domain-containing protein [Candidatus Hydrogenedentes bacterium]|nr:DUF1559 domain-containing protein [Candidatus Hydrogenedentota bacterium]
MPALARARESARRASCANNLKQMGLVFKMYANESKGQKFPTMKWCDYDSATPNPNCECNKAANFGLDLFPNMIAVYPEYLSDSNILICPSDPEGTKVEEGQWLCEGTGAFAPAKTGNISYIYYGWAMKGEYMVANPGDINYTGDFNDVIDPDTLVAILGLAADVQGIWADPATFSSAADGDVNVPNTGTARFTIYRLREGIERFFITDINNPAGSAQAQSELAVMHDDVNANIQQGGGSFNHVPGGGNVLYMDGHVEFVKYPGEWPICAMWSNVMANLSY